MFKKQLGLKCFILGFSPDKYFWKTGSEIVFPSCLRYVNMAGKGSHKAKGSFSHSYLGICTHIHAWHKFKL
jgi:hypothetical protein